MGCTFQAAWEGQPWPRPMGTGGQKGTWRKGPRISFLLFFTLVLCLVGFSAGSEFACNVGDPGSIPGLGRSPGGGHDNPLQYSCLENPMDRKAWWATISGVTRVSHDLAAKPSTTTVFQFSHSVVSNSLQPHGQASLSITNSWSLLKLMSIVSVIPPYHLILCHPHLLLPSIFPSCCCC